MNWTMINYDEKLWADTDELIPAVLLDLPFLLDISHHFSSSALLDVCFSHHASRSVTEYSMPTLSNGIIPFESLGEL